MWERGGGGGMALFWSLGINKGLERALMAGGRVLAFSLWNLGGKGLLLSPPPKV